MVWVVVRELCSNVEGVVGVEDIDACLLGRLGVLDGRNLVQIIDNLRLGPDLIVQPPVQYRRGIRAHDLHCFGPCAGRAAVLR